MEDIEKKFYKYVKKLNNYKKEIPPDVLLKIYGYYKRSTGNNLVSNSGDSFIDSFKINALLQMKKISKKEAMKNYIIEAEKILNKK